MPTVYVGYTLTTRPDWEQYVGEIKAPGNYKDPVKIEAYKEEAKKKRAAEAAERVLTGQLDEMIVVTSKGVREPVTGAVQFFEQLLAGPRSDEFDIDVLSHNQS